MSPDTVWGKGSGAVRVIGIQKVQGNTLRHWETRTKFTKSRNPLESVLFLETPLWLTFGCHCDPPSHSVLWFYSWPTSLGWPDPTQKSPYLPWNPPQRGALSEWCFPTGVGKVTGVRPSRARQACERDALSSNVSFCGRAASPAAAARHRSQTASHPKTPFFHLWLD